MRRLGSRTHSCAYDVEITWQGAEALYLEHVASGQPFQLRGQAAHDDVACFVVPPAWLDGDERTLVTVSEAHVHAHLDDCIIALSRGESAELAIGPLHIRVTHSAPVPRPDAAPLSFAQHRWTLASFAVHGFALLCMAMMPPTAQSMSLDLATEDARFLRYLATPIERNPPTLPWSEIGASESGAASAANAGEEGRAGRPDTHEQKRLAVAGTSRTRKASALAVDAENPREQGILGVLQAYQPNPQNFFPAGPPLGSDPLTALGALFGDLPGEGEGFHGLGMRGTGRHGGGDVTDSIGVGRLRTIDGSGADPDGKGPARALSTSIRRPHDSVPRAIMGEAQVKGSLSKDVIRREIHRHLNEVRFCYETALAHAPELAGRVSVTFLIAPGGVVQGASIAQSDVSAVELCLVQAVRRWTFPAPEGGGYVQVSYPFIFAADAP
jgi:TonB family protein